MIVTPTIKSLINEGKITHLRGFIAEGQSQYGMQTFDQSLIALVKTGLITKESAIEQASSPSEVDLGLKGISSSRASAQSMIGQMETAQQKERVAGWLKRSQELYEKRRYDEARAELKRVLQEIPEHKEANLLMARLREMDNQTEKKKDASNIVKSALQMYREGKQQAAIMEFQKALEVDPENKQVLAYIKSIQEEMENRGKARELFQAALSLQQQGDLAGSLAQVEKAMILDLENEQAKELRKNLKNAIQKEQAKARANELNLSAIDMYKAGDLLGALVNWNKAYDLNSDLEDVGRYLQQGITKLLSFGVEGIDGLPEKEVILSLFEQGVRAYVHSDFLMAMEFFKKALSKAEGNGYLTAYLQKSSAMLEGQIAVIFQEGWKNQQAGDLVAAQKEYTKVIKLSPGHPEAMRQLGALRAAIQQETEKLFNEGKANFDQNNMDRAIQIWERILELDPSNEKTPKRIEEAKIKKKTMSGLISKIG
jgi:tetratricopeptide (TPR) repeat protein